MTAATENKVIYSREASEELVFSQLPAFAGFVKEKYLLEFTKYQLELCKEIDLPLLKQLAHLSPEQLLELSIAGQSDFLTCAEENRLKERTAASLKKWENDEMVVVSQHDFVIDDIIKGAWVRKEALLKFLPYYTNDPGAVLEIVREIDQYNLHISTVSADMYIKLMKKQLQQKTEQLLEAQELSHTGSYILNIETEQIEVTPQFLKIFEIDDIKNRKQYAENIHPGDVEKVNTAREKAISENGVFDEEYRYIVRGVEKIIWARGAITFVDGKKFLKGTVMDVTERSYMIKRLQRSEEMYKQAQAMSHIGNWVWDLINNKLEWSDEMYRIYEMEIGSKVNNDAVYAMHHSDDVEKVRTIVRKSMETGEPYDFTYRIVFEAGRIKTVHAKGSVVVDKSGKAFKMYGTLQDVTLQKATEETLMENEAFIQKIADTSPSLIASYNIHTGKYTYINSAFRKILGYDPKLVYNQGVAFMMTILHPDDVQQLMEKNTGALDEANSKAPKKGQEAVVEFKYRLKNAKGHYRWFRTFSTVFDRNAEGKVEHLLNVSIDITDQEDIEQELSQKNMQLKQSNASLEEFAYVASHDLSEPLRKIATFTDLVHSSKDNKLTTDSKVYLKKVSDACIRMQKMVSDLLAISIISRNIDFESCELQTILEEVKQVLEMKIEEKKATIKADKLPKVWVIAPQFRQLFQNLIANALKFARKDVAPVIKIKCKYLTPADVTKYKMGRAKRYLQIDFTDNGIGLENKYANKIFTIFQRLHGKNEYEGTGIGLAICKKVAENHGGVIYANGEPGKGTTFTIIIPAWDPDLFA